jgi:glycosyltransferase involved in cell wall biosynthesis
LLEGGDAHEIAGKVVELADDAERRAAIGAAGHRFALRRLRWSRNVDVLVDLYREVGIDLG